MFNQTDQCKSFSPEKFNLLMYMYPVTVKNFSIHSQE